MNLAALGKLLAPLILNLWKTELEPAIVALEASIGSEHVKLVVEALEGALDKVVEGELAKLAGG